MQVSQTSKKLKELVESFELDSYYSSFEVEAYKNK